MESEFSPKYDKGGKTMKYKIIDRYPSEPMKKVSNELEIIFYDDDGNYLGKVRPWHFYENEENLDVIGNKKLRINVLSYKEEPIDTSWVAFGAHSSTPIANGEGG